MIKKGCRPLIGVTACIRSETQEQYVSEGFLKAFERLGADVMMIRHDVSLDEIGELTDKLDGVLFSGGGDIDPAYYGHKMIPECGKINVQRDALEMKLFEEAYARKMPMLGICRGMQVINVAMGGTLYQDLPVQQGKAHRQPAGTKYYHNVRIKDSTRLAEALGTLELITNSHHHQSVMELADGLKLNAMSEDGVVEGYEEISGSCITGIQWHPEGTVDDDEYSMKIFSYFIDRIKE